VARRVSLKGRGADIFFGDYTPPSAETPAVDEVTTTAAGEEPAEVAPEAGGDPAPRPDERAADGPARRHPRSSTKQASLQASKLASLQEIQSERQDTAEANPVQASKLASKHASLQSETQAGDNDDHQPGGRLAEASGPFTTDSAERSASHDVRGAAVGDVEVEGEVLVRIDAPAAITSSFRYTEAELSALTDVLYEVSKQSGARVTKQDVARLGLNVVLEDYYRRGQKSLLGQLAARRRRRPGG